MNLVDSPGVEQNTFRQRGLARIDVGRNAEVAEERDVVLPVLVCGLARAGYRLEPRPTMPPFRTSCESKTAAV